MNKEKIIYITNTYSAVKAALYALPSLILLLVLVMTLARSIHSEAMAVLGSVFVCSFPFLFQKKYKTQFTRRVVLEFDEQGFVIKEHTLKTKTFIKEFAVNWIQIRSYKCSFSSSNMTFLNLYLKDGSLKSFSFKDEKTQEQAIKEKSVFSIFNYYAVNYNSNQVPEDKITLRPSFLTTRLGTIVLYTVGILAVITIVIHHLLESKTFMLSFMSLFIVLGLLVKRRTDKLLYNKISTLDSRLPFD